jgi:hypothetical protein
MAGGHFDCCCLETLDLVSLQLGLDHPVVGRDDLERGNGVPRGLGKAGRDRLDAKRALCRCDEFLFVARQVRCEVVEDAFVGEL